MKNIKLKNLIKNFDSCTKVVIEKDVGFNIENWETVFKGYAMDVPWIYMNNILLPPDDNGEPIEVCMKDGEPYVHIAIIEKEDLPKYLKKEDKVV
jgi:hypothetical protein